MAEAPHPRDQKAADHTAAASRHLELCPPCHEDGSQRRQGGTCAEGLVQAPERSYPNQSLAVLD